MKKKYSLLLLAAANITCNTYYSENGQDKYVNNNYFYGKKEGFFVDIGAHAGVCNSNSYFFEQLGWNGICFEPDPRTYTKLEASRNCILYNTAVGSVEGIENFIQHPCTFVSGLDRTYCDQHRKVWRVPKKKAKRYFIKVPVVRLSDVLKEHEITYVDFLSIDTEGAEKDIITAIDFDECYFHIIVLENKYHDDSIDSFLKGKGFKYITRLKRDQVYENTNPKP